MVSQLIQAIQGIVAGSGSATTEMWLLMMDVVDSAYRVYPQVVQTVVVDDLSAEADDSDPAEVVRVLSGFLVIACSRLTSDGLEISATKSVVTATTRQIGEAVAQRLGAFKIKCLKFEVN